MAVRREAGEIGTSHLMNHMISHRKEPGLYPEEQGDERIHGHGRDLRMYWGKWAAGEQGTENT